MSAESELERLNTRVTRAILKAEDLEHIARKAYRDVAVLEEKIAAICAPVSIEGEIARCGAICAYLRAALPEQALECVDRYLREPVTESMQERLVELREQAAREAAQ